MCRLYQVTRAGYYAWRKRPLAKSKRDNERVLQQIKKIHQDSDRSYGSPRVHAALLQQGEQISENRTARIMRSNQVRARIASLYRPNPGHHEFFASICNRSLEELADRPNRVWVGDVTYLKVGAVWLYLAVVMDKYSRRIVGWAISRERTTRLVIKALDQAVQARRPAAGTIFHSDRGIEYVSYAYRDRLAKLGIVQSMNRPRRMNDDFMTTGPEWELTQEHYAFLVSEDEFDQIFGRIQERGLEYFADPHGNEPGEINHHDGGRGVYWLDPDRHVLEIITRPVRRAGRPADGSAAPLGRARHDRRAGAGGVLPGAARLRVPTR